MGIAYLQLSRDQLQIYDFTLFPKLSSINNYLK